MIPKVTLACMDASSSLVANFYVFNRETFGIVRICITVQCLSNVFLSLSSAGNSLPMSVEYVVKFSLSGILACCTVSLTVNLVRYQGCLHGLEIYPGCSKLSPCNKKAICFGMDVVCFCCRFYVKK